MTDFLFGSISFGGKTFFVFFITLFMNIMVEICNPLSEKQVFVRHHTTGHSDNVSWAGLVTDREIH